MDQGQPLNQPNQRNAATDTGVYRSHNEDDFYYFDRPDLEAYGKLFIVADGVGGNVDGKYASRTAIKTIKEIYYNTRHSQGSVKDSIRFAIDQANQKVYQHGQSINANVSCTVVVAIIFESTLCVAHAGDARAYILRRGNDQLEPLTQDHSWVGEQVAAGILTPEEAGRHELRNVITRAVGSQVTIEPAFSPPLPVQQGDQILLCSDGLYNTLDPIQIVSKMRDHLQTQDAAYQLVELAKTTAQDNVTALVYQIGSPNIVVGGDTGAAEPIQVTRPLPAPPRPVQKASPTVFQPERYQLEPNQTGGPASRPSNSNTNQPPPPPGRNGDRNPKQRTSPLPQWAIISGIALIAVLVLAFFVFFLRTQSAGFSMFERSPAEEQVNESPTQDTIALAPLQQEEEAPLPISTSTVAPTLPPVPATLTPTLAPTAVPQIDVVSTILDQDEFACVFEPTDTGTVFYWSNAQIAGLVSGANECERFSTLSTSVDLPVYVDLSTLTTVVVDQNCQPIEMVQVEPLPPYREGFEFETAYVHIDRLKQCREDVRIKVEEALFEEFLADDIYLEESMIEILSEQCDIESGCLRDGELEAEMQFTSDTIGFQDLSELQDGRFCLFGIVKKQAEMETLVWIITDSFDPFEPAEIWWGRPDGCPDINPEGEI